MILSLGVANVSRVKLSDILKDSKLFFHYSIVILKIHNNNFSILVRFANDNFTFFN